MDWDPVVLERRDVAARPHGLWTLVAAFVAGPALLRITVNDSERWSYADTLAARCGPNGDPGALLSNLKCLLPHTPVGALIGKIGGSAAAVDGGAPFAVGTSCVVRIPDEGGPLYLTINDEFTGMRNNAGSIAIRNVERAPLAPKPAAKPTVADAVRRMFFHLAGLPDEYAVTGSDLGGMQ